MTPQANGKAVKTRSTFRMEYAVSIAVNAEPDRVWALLTDAANFPRWNSTVQSISGRIALGETIQLKATISGERVFKLKVVKFVPNQHMVWQDGRAPFFQGTRQYAVSRQKDGATVFSMSEAFARLMLPMIAGALPDFTSSFEQYAADLKREAERG